MATQPLPFQKEAEEIWLRQVANKKTTHEKCLVTGLAPGRVEFSEDNGKSWRVAKVGDSVSAHTVIRTDLRGAVVLSFDESRLALTVRPKSWLRVIAFDIENTGIEIALRIMIELERGTISGHLSKMAAASTVMVRTHKGIVEPHGPFEVMADGGVRADGGRVHADGTIHKIEPGQEFFF